MPLSKHLSLFRKLNPALEHARLKLDRDTDFLILHALRTTSIESHVELGHRLDKVRHHEVTLLVFNLTCRCAHGHELHILRGRDVLIPVVNNNKATRRKAGLDLFCRQMLCGLVQDSCPVECHVVRGGRLVGDLAALVLTCDSRNIAVVRLGEERHH